MKQNNLLRAARVTTLVAAAAASLVAASVAHADDSEQNAGLLLRRQPGGFRSRPIHHGHRFHRNTFTVYNRLVEFERGGTKVEPGLAEKWDVSRRRQDVHVPSAPRREVPDHVVLQADARIQCGRRACSRSSACSTRTSRFARLTRSQFPYFTDMGLDKLITQRRKGRSVHGQVHAEGSQRAVHPESGDGIRVDPVGRIRRPAAEGRQGRRHQPVPGRHGPVHLPQLHEGRDDPLRRQSGLLEAERR